MSKARRFGVSRNSPYLDVVPKSLEEMSQVTKETLPSYVTSVHGVKSVSDFIGAENGT